MKLVFADTETFSSTNLRTQGSARYAEGDDTEIIVAQWAIGDGEPVIWDCTEHGRPQEFLDLLADPDVMFVFHNAAFDRQVIGHCWDVELPPERCIDTMAQALAHGLPGGLDKIGQIVGLAPDEAKDKRGRALIQLFCVPRPTNMKLRRATRHTHPIEWQEFLAYGGQDIVAMRAVYYRLPKWNYRPGHAEYALWCLDAKINARGFAVDLALAEAAIGAVAAEQARLKTELSDLTDGAVSSPSKRDELLVHILMEYGVSLPDMKADTLRRRMEDPELPEPVKLLLAIRLEATKTSTAKYKALTNAISGDGRLRNTTQFCGASRTGRDAHRLFQPGNMPRPDMEQEQIDLGIEALKAGCAPLIFSDVMRLTANAVRGCIVAPPGRKLCVADLSNIEGRGLAVLAGESWKIKAFADFDAGIGADLYKLSYARAFNVSPDFDHKTVVGHMMRQIGKVMELGLGYGGGVAAFLTFAAVYGLDLDQLAAAVWESAPAEWLQKATEMLEWFKRQRRSTMGLTDRTWVACEALVLMWRAAHPATVELWKNLEDAFRSAILEPGATFTVRDLKVRRDGAWLRVRLPSGRYLCYVNPSVSADNTITYHGVSQYTRQWTRIKTYGGKSVENVVQAWARDVLFYRTPDIEAAGYRILVKIHDELLTETPDTDEFSHQHLAALMAAPPAWAPNAPLAAAGFETYRYMKG